QICYTGVSCEQAEKTQLADYERYRYVASAPFTQWNDGVGGAMEESLNTGSGFAAPMGGGMAQPRFYPGAWGSCSTTCGPGVRARSVECVAFQGITGSVIKLPEYECEGSPKPPLFEPCQLRQCPLSESGNSAADVLELGVRSRGFRWEYGDWAACSASCLGGKQKSTLKCVEVAKNTPVAWSYCDPKQRPIDITRTCNNQPCPPSWE
uniref:Uncharacterized protein n=1 Tax=Plectus sambesii TaxID=2011161 RepID=A0A914V9W9_9BILA